MIRQFQLYISLYTNVYKQRFGLKDVHLRIII